MNLNPIVPSAFPSSETPTSLLPFIQNNSQISRDFSIYNNLNPNYYYYYNTQDQIHSSISDANFNLIRKLDNEIPKNNYFNTNLSSPLNTSDCDFEVPQQISPSNYHY